MLTRRNAIRNRVSKKFARVPGEHGDAFVPAFYPIAINPGWWGTPWAKVQSRSHVLILGAVSLGVLLYVIKKGVLDRARMGVPGKRALPQTFCLGWADLDDPDYMIKWNELQKEIAENKLESRWGGTNFLASYLWQPGEPEPDIRRKEAPAHH